MGRVPSHDKEKESGQKVKGDWGKKEFVVVLRETGSLVRVGSGEFYIRLLSIRILARLSMEASLLLFVIIQVYVERERDNRR